MRHNFTMVELLAAMAVIVILAGLGVGVYALAMNRNKTARTEALLKRVEIALETVKRKHGAYPQTMEGYAVRLDLLPAGATRVAVTDGTVKVKYSDASEVDFTAMVNDFVNTIGEDRLKGHVLELASGVTGVDPVRVLCDAWGNPLYYRSPGEKNTTGFDLGSAGPDGNVNGKNLWQFTRNNGALTKIELKSGFEFNKFDTEKSDDMGNF